MLTHTIKENWFTVRNAIATIDWPTATNVYNPVATVTHRLVSRMLNTLEVAIDPVNIHLKLSLNKLVLRAHLSDAEATATMHIFGSCRGELTAKYLGQVVWTAGTQTNENDRYFAKTAVVTSYAFMGIAQNATDESGTGIAEVAFDTTIYDRIWIGFTTISAGNITIEGNGY